MTVTLGIIYIMQRNLLQKFNLSKGNVWMKQCYQMYCSQDSPPKTFTAYSVSRIGLHFEEYNANEVLYVPVRNH